MKVLLVIDSLGPGGAQKQLVELAIGLKERGFEVSFLTYHPQNFFMSRLTETMIPVTSIIVPNYLKRLLKMRTFIRAGRYDSVLSFLEAPNIICEIAGFPYRNWKLIVGERSADPNLFKSFKLKIYRWFHLLADIIIANSNENIKMVKKINPFISNKCHVIYNMIDLDKWKPDPNYIPFKNGKFNLLVAASFGDVKNLIGLVNAVKILSPQLKDRLNIEWFGNENQKGYLNKVMEKIEEYKLQDHFTFYPFTNNMLKHMQHADTIGLFSFYEGLPNAICEGMAIGKPVIATAISDLPLIVNDPEWLCDPNSPESIANSITHFMKFSSDEIISIGQTNRTKAKSLFNKSKIVNDYISLLN